jgi:hypothetical protein
VRKALLLLGLMAALAVPAVAAAKAPPSVACGPQCTGGGGWTGCTSTTASHSASVLFIASIRHYLVVSYCKSYGIITSISIAAHGCDTSGLVSCSTGPAWQTGGGVGATSATFEAHATWIVTTTPFVTNNDVVTLTVPAG